MTTIALNFIDASLQRKTFASQAAVLLERIVNDNDFIQEVKAAKFSRSKFRLDDTGVHFTTKKTGKDIAELIVGGKEFRESPNGIIALQVVVRLLRKKTTVGAMTPPKPLITTNSRFFDKWVKNTSTVSCAAHWMHEWLHVAGFRHISNGGDDAPYVVGKLAAKAGKRLLKGDAASGAIIADTDLGADYLSVAIVGHEEFLEDEEVEFA